MSDNPPSAIEVHRGSVSSNGATTSLRFELRKGKDFKVCYLCFRYKTITNDSLDIQDSPDPLTTQDLVALVPIFKADHLLSSEEKFKPHLFGRVLDLNSSEVKSVFVEICMSGSHRYKNYMEAAISKASSWRILRIDGMVTTIRELEALCSLDQNPMLECILNGRFPALRPLSTDETRRITMLTSQLFKLNESQSEAARLVVVTGINEIHMFQGGFASRCDNDIYSRSAWLGEIPFNHEPRCMLS